MPVDFLTLLRRDHADLQMELTRLLDPGATLEQLRVSLDGVRLGLIAHAEAEDIVLSRFESVPSLLSLVVDARAAHLIQETALSALVTTKPATTTWRERASHLRELVQYHAMKEEECLLPALRRLAADYSRLAGAFATERLRQLAMLQPSAPIYGPSALAALA
jgi:hypothetical protein